MIAISYISLRGFLNVIVSYRRGFAKRSCSVVPHLTTNSTDLLLSFSSVLSRMASKTTRLQVATECVTDARRENFHRIISCASLRLLCYQSLKVAQLGDFSYWTIMSEFRNDSATLITNSSRQMVKSVLISSLWVNVFLQNELLSRMKSKHKEKKY